MKGEKKKKRHFGWAIAAGILIGLILLSSTMFLKMKNQLAQIDHTPVDISRVADGVYDGTSETQLVKVAVRVSVNSGTITDIEILRHECGKGAPAAVIIDDMKARNTVEVDGVSGATASGEVIKDAVRNALRKGL